MKRFAVLTEWNSEVAEKIRSDYKKHFNLDLKTYIPQEKGNFSYKWNELMDISFKQEWSCMGFDEVSIRKFVYSFLLGSENDEKLLNAVNRYELYEADVWISAAYTIQYLKADEQYKKINLNDVLKKENSERGSGEDLKHIIYQNDVEVGKPEAKFFCRMLLRDLLVGNKLNLFDGLLNIKQNFLSNSQRADWTTWSWQKILQYERDILYSQLITEKEYNEKKEEIKEKLKGKNLKMKEELKKLRDVPKVEDYLLYWKLTGGELVRRFLPAVHTYGKKWKFDIEWLDKLCRIDSVSWQIFLIEINKIGLLNNEINYPSLYDYESIFLPGAEDSEILEYQKCIEFQTNKFKDLLEWESRMVYCEREIINKNRKLLVEAMVYLYMSSDVRIQEGILETIQIYSKDVFQAIQTPPVSNFKRTIGSYIRGEIDIKDTLTKEMIEDLKKRVKNRKNGEVKKFTELPQKIRLQVGEDSLTVRYILLQRLMIRIIDNIYKLSVETLKL